MKQVLHGKCSADALSPEAQNVVIAACCEGHLFHAIINSPQDVEAVFQDLTPAQRANVFKTYQDNWPSLDIQEKFAQYGLYSPCTAVSSQTMFLTKVEGCHPAPVGTDRASPTSPKKG